MNENQPRRSIVTPLVLFGLTTTAAVILLITTLVVWLAEVTGSMIWATLIVGGFFAIVATIVYFASVRGVIRYIRDQMENISEMAQLIKAGYRWVTDKINSILCELLSGLLRKL